MAFPAQCYEHPDRCSSIYTSKDSVRLLTGWLQKSEFSIYYNSLNQNVLRLSTQNQLQDEKVGQTISNLHDASSMLLSVLTNCALTVNSTLLKHSAPNLVTECTFIALRL